MARWTDGRRTAAGVPERGGMSCERRPSPEGIRSLNLGAQWVAIEKNAMLVGVSTSTHFKEVDPINFFTASFRCVQSVSPSADPGRATVVADQSDPWLLGGPA
ncbi:MAG: hypothetical protein R3B06_26460 [Kofleriaceae bacterium]